MNFTRAAGLSRASINPTSGLGLLVLVFIFRLPPGMPPRTVLGMILANMLLFRASPVTTVKGSIMNAGMVALISITGLGWLGSSFFEGNRNLIIAQFLGLFSSIRGFL